MKNYRWAMVMVGLIALLMVGSMVWASPPASSPGAPLMQNADTVDGFHAVASSAGAVARANKLLAAGSNGRFPIGVMPTGNLDTRYVNDNVAETISGASGGVLLTVNNTGTGPGVRGISASHDGVQGGSSVAGRSGVYAYNTGSGYGMYGDSTSGFGVAAVGGGDGSGTDRVGDLLLGGNLGEIFSFGSVLELYSDRFVHITIDDNNNDADDATEFRIFNGANNNVFSVDELGNTWAAGTKGALVKTEDHGLRTLYAMESPEVWFEDFGMASLVEGVAKVAIEPIFAETVNLDDYHIFLTPLGDCKGLYVAKKTATSFEVRELGGGTSNIEFDYRIVAKRLGYEDVRMEAVAAGTLTRR